jgi:Fumarylacetoacetate (FAA) hydrolase family
VAALVPRSLGRALEGGEAFIEAARAAAESSASEPLVAGTLLGSGTVGGGCGAELGRRLSPGDIVELEIEGIGTLRNRLGRPPADGWMPSPQTPARSSGSGDPPAVGS